MIMNRRTETKLIKDALKKAGYTQTIEVHHGAGTAYGWVDITLSVSKPADCTCESLAAEFYPDKYPLCDHCRRVLNAEDRKVTEIVIASTGRTRGDYDGNTSVRINLT